jgi:uroporphyrinogen-III synthase
MRRVLVLRPEPGASATVERARTLGLGAAAVPLFRVEPMAWAAPEPAGFDGLLMTSANAVRHGGEALARLKTLKVHAVGESTADAARAAGFEVASVGERGVDELLASLEPGLRLLHLTGADRRDAADARQAITPISVYRAEPIDNPRLDAAGSVALIHSPRAGRRFAELVTDRGSIAVAAISEAAAAAVGVGWERVEAAAEPTGTALLALAARLCNNLAQE